MTMPTQAKLAAGTGSSVVVERCQICENLDLESVLFLGYLPPVNQMRPLGQRPHEQPAYPAELLYCPRCQLVQIGLIVDPNILFPPEYPYTSGTTKILRDNFAELYRESSSVIALEDKSLVIDIGSNDGTLLSNFQKAGHRVLGIEPTQTGKLALAAGIPTITSFFDAAIARTVCDQYGPAKIVTATNVFAHIENIHEITDSIASLLDSHGVFVSESHYLLSLLETLQYDTIYHEHLRYYSLHSLKYLLNAHGLEVFHARRIPTHGGSMRVYAARPGDYPVQPSVNTMLQQEQTAGIGLARLEDFRQRVALTKLQLHALLLDLKQNRQKVYGIGAPSRASTLINYVGLDAGILDCVCEVKGSHKTGKYMPGTLIPVVEESRLFEDQPDYALVLSWHIAEELMPKLRAKGFEGDFIVPLPTPRIVGA
jgi:hypothetical protein